jgi:hypothetical protein
MIGFSIDYCNDIDYEEKIEKLEEENCTDYYYGIGFEGGAKNDNSVIIGQMLAEFSSEFAEGVGYKELNIERDMKGILNLAAAFGVDKKDIKYITGTRMC